MKAYVATGEYAQLICAYDQSPVKALKKIAKLIDKMLDNNETLMLSSVNVHFDDDGYYNVTATVSTTNYNL